MHGDAVPPSPVSLARKKKKDTRIEKMKISMAKRLFSGFMAAMTFLSTWGMTSVTTMASGTDYGYPELSEVIGSACRQ